MAIWIGIWLFAIVSGSSNPSMSVRQSLNYLDGMLWVLENISAITLSLELKDIVPLQEYLKSFPTLGNENRTFLDLAELPKAIENLELILFPEILTKNLQGLPFSKQYEKIEDQIEDMRFLVAVHKIYPVKIGQDAWEFIMVKRTFNNWLKADFTRFAVQLTEAPPRFDPDHISRTKDALRDLKDRLKKLKGPK
jgi:transcriptional regulator of heat shock response